MKYALYISILSKTSLTWEITSFTSSEIILCIVFFWFGWSLKFCFLFVKFTAKLCSISDPFLNNFILKLLTSTFKFIYDGLPPDLKTVLIFFSSLFFFLLSCSFLSFWYDSLGHFCAQKGGFHLGEQRLSKFYRLKLARK